MSRLLLSLVLLALLCGHALSRVPQVITPGASNDACGACKIAVHVMSDMLCDPYVDDTVAQWVVDNVCSQFDQKDTCTDMVRGLAPALVEWLRANANPEAMCAQAGVCGASLYKDLGKLQVVHSNNRPNDITCPLCMYVAAKVKEQINDPVTQADIHDASLAACAAMPEGMMRDACTTFVEEYEMTFVKYMGNMEPAEVCMMVGTCLDAAVARAGHMAALRAETVATVSSMMTLMQAHPNNDHCDTCKVVVTEMHQLVANPEMQVQLVDYAKQACDLLPSYADTCKADVDQYAPMMFGMILAYLQPEQVCIQLKLCPPPSLVQKIAMQASTLQSKFSNVNVNKVFKA